jgi:hypothetical protein
MDGITDDVDPKTIYDELIKRDTDNQKKGEEDPSFAQIEERHKQLVKKLEARKAAGGK